MEARDRILEATASAANALLIADNFDTAVNTALQIIGEALDTDRVCVGEHYDDPAGKTLGYVRYLYEWDSPYAARQIEQSDFVEITYEGTELVHALSNQATLAIQLTRLAEEAKLAAIAREQEKAATERADELAKANLALQRCVEKISQDSSLEKLLSHVLVEAANLSSACGGGLFVRQSPAKAGFRPIAIIKNGVLRSGEDWLAQGGIERFVERSAADETDFFKQLTQGKLNYLCVDEPDGLWWADSIAYHQRFGHRVVMHIPMMLHGEVLGLFALCFKQVIEPKPEIVEYLTTLANQATLALELTRLAEEAKQAAIAREQ